MGIDIIFRIAAVGILAAVTCAILKQSGKDDISMFVSLAAVIICIAMVLGMISDLFNVIKDMFVI
jgi:stage III sporulation protein AC